MRARGHRLHGIQSWVGLPKADEEVEPAFHHFSRDQLPEREDKGVALRLIAGEVFGQKSPVKVFSPIFYADARFAPGGALHYTSEHEERAFFVVEGEVQTNETEVHGTGAMLMLDKGEEVTLYADAPARVMLLGGAPLDGPRHIWWNFVSSSKDRIERAKQEWKDGQFGLIPGDDKEFIPLPENR